MLALHALDSGFSPQHHINQARKEDHKFKVILGYYPESSLGYISPLRRGLGVGWDVRKEKKHDPTSSH